MIGKLLGLDRMWFLFGGALLIVGLFCWLAIREANDDRANQELGARVQREGDLRETIERKTEADDARQQVLEHFTVGSPELYDQCLLTARSPENCERFLSRGAAADSRAGPRP